VRRREGFPLSVTTGHIGPLRLTTGSKDFNPEPHSLIRILKKRPKRVKKKKKRRKRGGCNYVKNDSRMKDRKCENPVRNGRGVKGMEMGGGQSFENLGQWKGEERDTPYFGYKK